MYKMAEAIVANIAQHNRKLCPEMKETFWQVYVIKDNEWNAFTTGVSDIFHLFLNSKTIELSSFLIRVLAIYDWKTNMITSIPFFSPNSCTFPCLSKNFHHSFLENC